MSVVGKVGVADALIAHTAPLVGKIIEYKLKSKESVIGDGDKDFHEGGSDGTQLSGPRNDKFEIAARKECGDAVTVKFAFQFMQSGRQNVKENKSFGGCCASDVTRTFNRKILGIQIESVSVTPYSQDNYSWAKASVDLAKTKSNGTVTWASWVRP